MANQEYSVNLGLDIVPISRDSENLGDLYRLYNACKLTMSAIDQYTGILGAPQDQWNTIGADFITSQNQNRHYAQAAVNISGGAVCGLDATGKIVLATAGAVIGWAPFSIAANDFGEIRLFGVHIAVAGLTPGTWYYASAGTPGAITATVTGQKIGYALKADRLFFNPA